MTAQLIGRRWIWGGGGLSALLVLLLWFSVKAMLGYPVSTTQVSPSGRFVMENVRVGKIFMMSGMAYLRIIDKQEPGAVYRSPLYDTQSLDMRAFEDESEVGIYWISFNYHEKTFSISMPEWRESWLNVFISNTPYIDLKND